MTLTTVFCQFWLLLANFFVKFDYKVFWNLATLGRICVRQIRNKLQH